MWIFLNIFFFVYYFTCISIDVIIVIIVTLFEGNFILQTMFLRSDDFNTATPEALDGWMNIVRQLRPREIMVYTIDRETPDKSLEKYTVEEMTAFVQPLLDEGFKIQVRG